MRECNLCESGVYVCVRFCAFARACACERAGMRVLMTLLLEIDLGKLVLVLQGLYNGIFC